MEYKMVPYDENGEKAVVGSLLIDGEAISDIVHVLSVEDFFTDQNRVVYKACLEVYHDGVAIDQITVARQLAVKDKLEEIGGAAYLSRLVAEIPTSAHIEYYAKIVRDLSINRKAISVAQKISTLAYTGGDCKELVLEMDRLILEIQTMVALPGLITPEELAKLGLEYYQELQQGKRKGIYTGIYELDQLTGGLFGGEFCILAARPGAGKSETMLSMAEYVGKYFGNGLIASLEMNYTDILDRLQSRGLGISPRRIRAGNYPSELMGSMINELAKVSEARMYLYRTGSEINSASVEAIQAVATHMKLSYGLRVIFIDYLGLLRVGEDKYSSYERTKLASKKLKNMARILDVPVICVCQLSREVERRVSHVPQLSDLRDAGDLEQDADAVWFLYRPEMYEDELAKAANEGKNITGQADIIIAKQRQAGEVAGSHVPILWNKDKRQYFGVKHGSILDTPEEFR